MEDVACESHQETRRGSLRHHLQWRLLHRHTRQASKGRLWFDSFTLAFCNARSVLQAWPSELTLFSSQAGGRAHRAY